MFDRKLKIAIVGIAVQHSMSPNVHSAFGNRCGIQVIPQLVEIQNSEEDFLQTMQDLKDMGYHGITVAQPFKELAFLRVCHGSSELAQAAGAVNTIRITNEGQFIGDNTDGRGLVNDIKKNFRVTIQGKRILLLGAGGAACGVIKPLLDENPSEIIIVNRTLIKAQALADKFSKYNCSASLFEDLTGSFDLIINATSASMQQCLPGPLIGTLVTKDSLCYDLYYQRDGLTVFEQWASDLDAHIANGVGMVVEQGAFAFNHWCARDMELNTENLIADISFHRSKLFTSPPSFVEWSAK